MSAYRSSVSLANGLRLDAGDALEVPDTARLALDQGRDTEVLVFDLPGPAR